MFHDEKSREGGGGERSNKRVREHIYALGFPLYINRNNFRTWRVKLLKGSTGKNEGWASYLIQVISMCKFHGFRSPSYPPI